MGNDGEKSFSQFWLKVIIPEALKYTYPLLQFFLLRLNKRLWELLHLPNFINSTKWKWSLWTHKERYILLLYAIICLYILVFNHMQEHQRLPYLVTPYSLVLLHEHFIALSYMPIYVYTGLAGSVGQRVNYSVRMRTHMGWPTQSSMRRGWLRTGTSPLKTCSHLPDRLP